MSSSLPPSVGAGSATPRELRSLRKRKLLSPAEEVLSIPYLSKRSVMSFLRQEEALALRATSRACRDAVAEHAWSECAHGKSVIRSSLALWRRCFPHATAANLEGNRALKDADMMLLRGIRTLHMDGCAQVTDAGLAHLSGIHALYMDGCALVTDAGLAHFSGIHTLLMNN